MSFVAPRRLHMLIAIALAAATATAQGQTVAYPVKPVHVVVTFPPGGTPDTYGRLMASELSALWSQSVLVENRTGASGEIGTDFVAKSPADGYTLLFGADAPITIAPNMNAKLPYDPIRDFAPIINVAQGPFTLMLNPAVPASNLRELIALARAQPGKLTYASSGNGSQQHLAMEMIRKSAGIDLVHIPYKGFGQALVDVLAGHVQMLFGGITASIPLVESGKLKGIGVTARNRVSALPKVAAIAEDIPGFEILAWYGFLAPAGTPPEILRKIHDDAAGIVGRAGFREKIARDGMEPVANTPEEFAAQIARDIRSWGNVVKAAGVKNE